LSEALAPVLRDLENSGTLLPDILTEQERAFDGRVSAMFYGTGGSGMGVSAMAGEPLPENRLGRGSGPGMGDRGALGHADRPATWPECPEHLGSHPLAARLHADRAVWTCPRTGQLICGVGQLPRA
jgi:hypothetical protein